jgi:hypothetical protein
VVLVSTLDQFQMPLVATIENLIPLAELGKKSSGPLSPVLPTTRLITSSQKKKKTRLITSVPISSGPMSSSGGATSFAHSRAVTNLNVEDGYSIKGSIPKSILWIYGCSSLCDGVS